jgi:hexokinase
MNITWVTSLPTGHETGTYLTLDLGGTNLRVCLITLTTPGNTKVEREEKYTIPGDVKRGTADKLWDFIADLLQRFVEEDHRTDKAEPLPLGFTFSYPATQERIDHGALQTWTKGWDVDGVEGQDVAGMLRQAIEKRVMTLWFCRLTG